MITLSKEGCKKAGVTIDEVLVLMYVHFGKENYQNVLDRLIKSGCIISDTSSLFPRYSLKPSGVKRLNDAMCYSNPKIGNSAGRIAELAVKLQEIFPQGKKDGTNYYWRGNKRDIERKLTQFFLRYEDTYTDEQIISATQRYVDSFNGNYDYMRLLQYFIWKVSIQDGTKLCTSDLASTIENEGQDNMNEEWKVELK